MKRVISGTLLVVGAFAAMLNAGCAGHRSSDPIVISDDSVVRLEEARALAKRAQAAEKAGRDDEAIDLYRQSLMHSQNLPVSWNALGLLYMKQKNYMEAQRMFLGAADVSPMDPKPYYNVGVVYDRTGWSEKALEYFLKSLDRDPRYLDSLRGAASSVLLLQRADQGALDRIHTALLLETDPAWRSFFEREQLRLKNSLDDERKMRAEFGVPPTPRRGSPVQDPQP